MSRIDDLIAAHCPDGVPFLAIAEFAECVVGGTPASGNPLFWDNGTIPWMKSGEVNKSIIYETENRITELGYDSCPARLVPAGSVVIALAGQGKTRGLVARTRIALSTNQSLCAITPNESVESDFLYFFLTTQYQRLRELSSGDGSRGGLNLSMIRGYKVPVPPLEVQREIVRVLDLFQSLEAELEAELEVRRRQYAHYRDSLLDFTERGGVRWMTLGEVAVIGTGSRNTADAEADGEYPFFVRSQEPLALNQFDFEESAVITAGDGVGVGKIFHFVEGRYALHQRAYRVVPNIPDLRPEFLFRYIQSDFGRYLVQTSVHSSVTSLRRPMFEKYPIPLPTLEEQDQVISVLRKFDVLVNDLSVGLPAELAARRAQYEYYRDRLLSFEEAA